MSSSESTTNFESIRKKILAGSGKQYWRSVEEFADGPEFEEIVKRNYPNNLEALNDGLSRRSFIKVMGASLALAGLSGCVYQAPEKIVPRVHSVEDVLPGKPLFVATAMTLSGIATGLLAKSYEGRPIKIEGNPDHPASLGGTDARAQASLLDMYDPDRSQDVQLRGNPSNWQTFMSALRSELEKHRADGGAGVRFLTETVTSPTLQAQFAQILTELPNARWYQYEPVNNDNAIAGAKMAFGAPAHTVYHFDKAQRILSLDADIFSDFNVRYAADAVKGRAVSEEKTDMNRSYIIETTVSLFGAKADHRLAIKPSQMIEAAKAIAAGLGVAGASSTYTENAAWIAAMTKDLLANRGKAVVVAGQHQPAAVHALAHAMNAALGAVGETVTYIDPLTPSDKLQIEQLRELVTDIDAKRVKMLVMIGGNPVYNTPADLKLNYERLKDIFTVHYGMFRDETGDIAEWHIPATHYLEAWSDARTFDGSASIVQPLIDPIYQSRSVHEFVQLFAKENYDAKGLDLVKGYWQQQNISFAARTAAAVTASAAPAPAASPTPVVAATPGSAASTPRSFEDSWRKAVHDGVIPNTAPQPKTFSVNSAFISQMQPTAAGNGPVEFTILPDPCVYDGRFTNNGWLQELPNPLNKVTWENVMLVSPKTAAELGLNRGNDPDEISGGERGTAFINTKGSNMGADLVTVTYQGGKISKPVPVWITPGQPDGVMTMFMGYGRTKAGRVGNLLGYSVFDVQRSDAMYHGFGSIEKTGESTQVASTQIHFNMEGRDILRVFDLDAFLADEHIGQQADEYPKSMYPTEYYQKMYSENYKWGMSIDLNSCIGCNACVVACQAENNIPVVGKEQVERSREMHWLRVDTYFTGDSVDNPGGAHFQPIPCQQCELAPCEVVCPVTATAHTPEGLNDMVYNRCVGTRYCSNNCPYKVRRFNFMLYQDWDTPQYKLMRNPEVSVRSRGVMEKCTYCTQRISAARIEAEKDGRRIRDGEVTTACQSACPTNAIVFGDMNDPVSKIAKAKADRRDYLLLNELNTQPRTTYLAGLKNQNHEMPDYRPLPIPKSHGGGHDAKPAGDGHGGDAKEAAH